MRVVRWRGGGSSMSPWALWRKGVADTVCTKQMNNRSTFGHIACPSSRTAHSIPPPPYSISLQMMPNIMKLLSMHSHWLVWEAITFILFFKRKNISCTSTDPKNPIKQTHLYVCTSCHFGYMTVGLSSWSEGGKTNGGEGGFFTSSNNRLWRTGKEKN